MEIVLVMKYCRHITCIWQFLRLVRFIWLLIVEWIRLSLPSVFAKNSLSVEMLRKLQNWSQWREKITLKPPSLFHLTYSSFSESIPHRDIWTCFALTRLVLLCVTFAPRSYQFALKATWRMQHHIRQVNWCNMRNLLNGGYIRAKGFFY